MIVRLEWACDVDTIDRRFIYAHVMNRLGGEYAACANVLYKALFSLY